MRDACLAREVDRLKAEARFIYMPRIIKEAVGKPCPRFWVSEERAAIVVAAMQRLGRACIEGMVPTRRAMFSELWLRARVYLRCNPGSPVSEAAAEAVHSPAPCFYLTEQSALRIYNRYKMRCRNGKR